MTLLKVLEKITTFLTENRELELTNVKYSSYGFIHNFNRETSYSALVICVRKYKILSFKWINKFII